MPYARLILLSLMLRFEFSAQNLAVQSTAFASGNYIPYRYTCDGENINPGFKIDGIPADAKSLILVMMDSTAAFGVFDHWIVWNIPPSGKIAENSSPGVTGKNSKKENKYMGPCPPNGIHDYYFRVYALSGFLNLPDTSSKHTVMKAMQGLVLSKGELKALFQRE